MSSEQVKPSPVSKKATKPSRSNGKREFNYEFGAIRFPKQKTDSFRVAITSTTEGAVIWMESRKTKQQWQASIETFSEFGPTGIPDEAVLAFFTRSLELASTESREMERDDPTIELNLEQGEAILTLTLSMGGIWRPNYSFSLLPVGLEKVDVLEAKLRDAQDEIAALKMGFKIPVLSVNSGVAVASEQVISWSVAAPRIVTASHFRMNADNKEVTILKKALYQINIQVGTTNASNSGGLQLQKNGGAVAFTPCSNPSYYQNIASINRVLVLDVNDTLRVMLSSCNGMCADGLTNNFSIVWMGELAE